MAQKLCKGRKENSLGARNFGIAMFGIATLA